MRMRWFYANVFIMASSSATGQLNLAKNPDFTTSSMEWQLESVPAGGAYYESFLGSPSGGSLRLETNTFNATSSAKQCISLEDMAKILNVKLDFSLRYVINIQGGTDATYTFTLSVFDGESCTGNVLNVVQLNENQSFAVNGVGANWREIDELGLPFPTGARSAQVFMQTSSGSDGVANYIVDHVLVGSKDVIFIDNVEM
jgi:hypothetical protein